MDCRGSTKSKKQLRLSTKRKSKRRQRLALLAGKSQSNELTTPTRAEVVPSSSCPQVASTSTDTSSNKFIPLLTSTPNVGRKKISCRKRRTVPSHLMKWRLAKKKRMQNPENELTMTSNITPAYIDPGTFPVCEKRMENPENELTTTSNITPAYNDPGTFPVCEKAPNVEKVPYVQSEILKEHAERQFDELVVEPDRRPPRDDVGIISGRFIVDGRHFVKEIRSLDYHRFECEKNSNGYMALVTSSSKLLEWNLKFRCPYCLKERIINSEPTHQLNEGIGSDCSLSESTSQMPLVDQIVWGFSSIGSGHRNMEEVLSSINISPISEKAFRTAEERLGQVWQDVLYDSMIEAGAEEKKLAIENGDVTKNNIPFITVIVDGGWSHRSHGHRYSANSGVACVIGLRTKKLLHIDVRNKYCSMCAYLEKKGISTGHDKCFKNWSGPSASMESDMLVEAFNSSEKIHGVQYRKMIGDGDSSVHQKVREMVSYGRFVEKVECTNHIIKNYTKRLYKLRSNGNTEKRFLNGNVIKRLKAAARGAIVHHSTEKNIEKLKEDLKNSPFHVLGNHLGCKPYFCKAVGTGNQLKDTSLYVANKVLEALKPVLLRANLLWENQTSNLAENYMSLVAKFTGGKQVNRGKRGSFTFRARAAALDFQYGPMWHYRSMKSHLKRSPAVLVKKIGLRRMKRLMTCRRALIKKKNEGKTKSKSTVTKIVTKDISGTKDYGSFCQRLDLEEKEFEEEKSDLLKSLALSDEEKASIEVVTRGQRENIRWLEERKVRLTASNFGLICKRRPKSLWAPVVKQLLYNKVSTGAMLYGELNESVALECFEKKHGTKVLPCGLFIDKTHDFLAASPDGVVDEQDLIEVKCPKSAELLTIPEAVQQIKSFCLVLDKNSKKIMLKRNHNYYYQVQGQLHIADKRRCHFVVWTQKDVHIEIIERCDRFWEGNMEKALCYFYNQALLPELVDPRNCRSMPIREPKCPLADFVLSN